jgi:hypothetical protein
MAEGSDGTSEPRAQGGERREIEPVDWDAALDFLGWLADTLHPLAAAKAAPLEDESEQRDTAADTARGQRLTIQRFHLD